MQEYLLLFFGIAILIYSLMRLKLEQDNQQQLFDLVAEAKLVQHNLLDLLNETKTTIDILVEQAEKAKELQRVADVEMLYRVETAASAKQEQPEVPQIDSPPKVLNTSDFKKERIHEMRKQGLAITEIAQQLSMGKGEVELYLNLLSKEVQK